MTGVQGREVLLRLFFVFPLIFVALTPPPAVALYYSLQTPVAIECHLRSELAEAAGDREGAIAWAESLAALEPASTFAMSRVALLYESSGEDMTALEWGERALALDSLNVDAAMLVGRMRLRSGEPGIAAQVLTPPLRQLGAIPELYALRALAHQLAKNYEAALADLKRTDSLLPDFAWIATGILSLALEDGRLEEAYSALQLALELRPDDSRTLALGILLAHRMGHRVLEENLLRQCALTPGATVDDVAAYGAFLIRRGKEHEFRMLLDWGAAQGFRIDDLRVGTGKALVATGNYKEALASVKPARRDPRAVPVRARAYLGLGEERRALRDYRALIPKRSLSREESLVVAYLEIRVGNRDQGVRTIEEVRATPLDNARQVLAASLCYSVLGHPEEAVSLIRDSAARGLASPSTYEQLGSAATALGDSLLAQWAWERLRELGRETSECLYFFASVEFKRGDAERAAQSLTRAIELNPRNGRALLLLGNIRMGRGQLEMARDILIRAARCPETATEANRALARVCRSLRLDSEAREAESRARSGRPGPASGLSFFQSR